MNNQRLSGRRNVRGGLTLMELVVVMVILIGLATLIIPRITGITAQAGSATSAAMLQGISEAEARFESQFGAIPTAWDGIVDASGNLYSKLNPKLATSGTATPLDAAGTVLAATQLDAGQAQSLIDAGMTGLHFQDTAWTGFPSDSGRSYQAIASGMKVCTLQLPTGSVTASSFDQYGHNVLFSDRAFSIQPFTNLWNNTFIVVGFGNEASLKRNAVQDTPLFTSATPSQYYARGLLVFMVPPTGTTTTGRAYFKAKYIGCFAPDGTCLMDNLNGYQSGQMQAN